MSDEEIVGLSPKKRLVTNITAAVGFLVLGIVLLILGILSEPLGFSFGLCVVPVCLASVFLVLFIVALYQKNSVSMYLSMLFLVSAVTTFLGNYEIVEYGAVYPLYILSPAVASVGAMLVSGDYVFHLKFIIFFALISFAFMLQSFFGFSFKIVLAVVFVILGLSVLILAVLAAKKGDKNLK